MRFDHNKYAVPYQYSSKMITVKGSGNQVIMLFRGKIDKKNMIVITVITRPIIV